MSKMKPLKYETLADRIRDNKLYRELRLYRDIVSLTVESKREPLLFVGGRAGVGKSFISQEECEKRKLKYAYLSPTSPFLFNRELYQYRNHDVIIMDDCDQIVSAPTVANLVKQAWGPDRTVHWGTVGAIKNEKEKNKKDSTKYDSTVPPRSYKVKAALIWLSNYNFTKEDAEGQPDLNAITPELRASFEAVQSRGGRARWIDANDTDLFRYSIYLATVENMFEKTKNYLSKIEAEEAVNFFNKNRNRLRFVNPRTLGNIAASMHAIDPKDRRRRSALQDHLLNKPIRDIPGFGKLEFVGRSKWKEECGTTL